MVTTATSPAAPSPDVWGQLAQPLTRYKVVCTLKKPAPLAWSAKCRYKIIRCLHTGPFKKLDSRAFIHVGALYDALTGWHSGTVAVSMRSSSTANMTAGLTRGLPPGGNDTAEIMSAMRHVILRCNLVELGTLPDGYETKAMRRITFQQCTSRDCSRVTKHFASCQPEGAYQGSAGSWPPARSSTVLHLGALAPASKPEARLSITGGRTKAGR